VGSPPFAATTQALLGGAFVGCIDGDAAASVYLVGEPTRVQTELAENLPDLS